MKKTIRPAARILETIGKDLIKDKYAAIVELVKNSYDADSPFVEISFSYDETDNNMLIKISDAGEGMSLNVVENRWMVPATDYKKKYNTSVKGRTLQGRKGIGRFSAMILGNIIKLTTRQNNKVTSLTLDINALNKIEYLDEYEVEISEIESVGNDGTIIEIKTTDITRSEAAEEWNSEIIKLLKDELKSLLSPLDVYKKSGTIESPIKDDEVGKFDIILKFINFPVLNIEKINAKKRVIDIFNDCTTLKPTSVLMLYDYRIYGSIDSGGLISFTYENQNIPSLPNESFTHQVTIESTTNVKLPGRVYIDLMVFDRDPDSLDNLIKRSTHLHENLNKTNIKQTLNDIYGVGIYRQQFRVRPYGDQSYDWLNLDKERVQMPSVKIGHNQIVGFIFIESEEDSGLIEKSARDGLNENQSFKGLQHIVNLFLTELAVRRVLYRKKTFKGRHDSQQINNQIDLLFDFSNIRSRLLNNMSELDIPKQTTMSLLDNFDEVIEIEQQKKSKYAKDIQEVIAMYENQAMLGRLTHIIVHEGRKYVKDLKETVPRIISWASDVINNKNLETKDKILVRSIQVSTSTDSLSLLFKKINPLARLTRAKSQDITLKTAIDESVNIFETNLTELSIQVQVESDKNIVIFSNKQDLITIFSNLIENSIYWLSLNDHQKGRLIHIQASQDSSNIKIKYQDNGPGFQGDNLELMFEPGYSTKPNGTGLGLSLAGDATNRNNGTIVSIKEEIGAVFQITFKQNNT